MNAHFCSGACPWDSAAAKLLYQVRSQGVDGDERSFEKPLFLTFVMFLAMLFALPAFWILEVTEPTESHGCMRNVLKPCPQFGVGSRRKAQAGRGEIAPVWIGHGSHALPGLRCRVKELLDYAPITPLGTNCSRQEKRRVRGR